jgi:hypothetical protein
MLKRQKGTTITWQTTVREKIYACNELATTERDENEQTCDLLKVGVSKNQGAQQWVFFLSKLLHGIRYMRRSR